jgi:hypothetical protein
LSTMAGVFAPLLYLAQLLLLALLNGLFWLYASRKKHQLPMCLENLLPRGKSFKKTPYLRTLGCLFLFSCTRCNCCLGICAPS